MYKEILRLKEMLEKSNILFDFSDLYDGYHIKYPDSNNLVCSVVEHFFSYGHNADKLEIMGLLTDTESKNDSVVGWLAAEEVFNRIKNNYESNSTS